MSSSSNWLLKHIQPHSSLLDPLRIPLRYAEATLADVPAPSLVKVVKQYGADFWQVAPLGKAPFFMGSPQTYKTFAAAALVRAIYHKLLINVGWCACANELPRLDREAFSERTFERIKYLKTVPFLVMDDFALTKGHGRQMDILIEIGTERFDNLLPTLWTANLELSRNNTQALDDAVGPALARRIMETSEGYRVATKKT